MPIRHLLCLVFYLCFLVLQTFGQTNVRAWNAAGQVFIVWETAAQKPLTYTVHASKEPAATAADAVRIGALFEPEWTGKRLKLANPQATWRIPDGKGGVYKLTPTEGLFVYTPHEAHTAYFHVAMDNDSLFTAANSTSEALDVTYDPQNEPVRCHPQMAAVTPQGFPFTVFAMWVDGRNDPDDARPDFPVMANAAKNGAPHVFAVFAPAGGLPAGPYPAVIGLHGGGAQGSYWSYAPNAIHYANTGNVPKDGVTITFDDRLFLSSNGVLNEDRPSNWFGWHTRLNATVPGNPPANAVVVPYTLRRLLWTIDWLIDAPAYDIDPHRVAIMGNSMGGTGTLLLSRWKPERFSAATAFVPPHYTPETGARLFGTSLTNFKTTEVGPTGDSLRINDFFDPAVRLSPITRDLALTRIYRGRCDDAAEWGPQHIQLFNALDDKGLGVHLYWDERDHTASDWTKDDPGNTCPDVGQWVTPVMTERCAASYQSRFRSDRSYPGIFHDDQDPAQPGRQPDLGNGNLTDGDPWGTWSGYYDWDVETLVDTPDRWECTLYLVGQSAVAVDNFPGQAATCDLNIRKPAQFLPAPGTPLEWRLIELASGQVLQSGTTEPDVSGLVTVSGLTLSKDPQRRRLIVELPSSSTEAADPRSAAVRIFPNPADRQVFLHDPKGGEWTYRLIDHLGTLRAWGTVRDQAIPLADLHPGLYTLLLLDAAGSRYVHPLLIAH